MEIIILVGRVCLLGDGKTRKLLYKSRRTEMTVWESYGHSCVFYSCLLDKMGGKLLWPECVCPLQMHRLKPKALGNGIEAND